MRNAPVNPADEQIGSRVMLRTIDQTIIEEVRDRILEACAPEAIVLFGSAARNEAVDGSDLDLLIILDLPEGITPRDKSRQLHALFFGWLLPLDIIVLTPAEWERGLQLPGHVARVAAREGVRLYG